MKSQAQCYEQFQAECTRRKSMITASEMAKLTQKAIRQAAMHVTGHGEGAECDDCPLCQLNGNADETES